MLKTVVPCTFGKVKMRILCSSESDFQDGDAKEPKPTTISLFGPEDEGIATATH